MRWRRQRERPSRSRVVSYEVEAPSGASFDEAPVERLLARARDRGVVTAYDTGRGDVVWFQGPPGPDMRALRADVIREVSR